MTSENEPHQGTALPKTRTLSEFSDPDVARQVSWAKGVSRGDVVEVEVHLRPGKGVLVATVERDQTDGYSIEWARGQGPFANDAPMPEVPQGDEPGLLQWLAVTAAMEWFAADAADFDLSDIVIGSGGLVE